MSAEITYEEKFKQLQNLLLAAFETFYTWKTLQNEEYNDLYKINSGFWGAVIPALQHEWFIGLARLFEDSQYARSGAIVSVYSLISEHPNKERAAQATEFLDKNKKVINNIARIRDHRHAHNNANFLVNPKDFEKRFSIKYSELESMFEFSDQLLGILHPEDEHGYMLNHLKEEAERDTKGVVEGLRYFNTKRNEHRQRWLKDRVGSIHFPPKESN